MSPRIRIGLIVGLIGLFIAVIIGAVLGICAPFIALAVGAAAGFFTARADLAATRSLGAQSGAISGGLAGVLMLVGQLIGALIALIFINASGMELAFGRLPDANNPAEMAGYFAGGVGVAFCIGLGNIVAAAIGGAAAGYLTTDERPLITNEL